MLTRCKESVLVCKRDTEQVTAIKSFRLMAEPNSTALGKPEGSDGLNETMQNLRGQHWPASQRACMN